MTKGNAEKALRDEIIPAFLANVSLVPVLDAIRDPEPKPLTVSAAVDRYLSLSKPRWSDAFKSSMTSIAKQIKVLGIRKDQRGKEYEALVRDIKPTDVQVWLNDLADWCSGSLMKKAITHVRAVFDLCLEDELITKNPARSKIIRRPLTKKSDETVLDLEQVSGLLYAAMHEEYCDYLIVRTALVCALRPGELFALRVEDVQTNQIMIDESIAFGNRDTKDPKTEGSKSPVPLPAALRLELLNYIETEGIAETPRALLFPSSIGTLMSPDNYLDRKLKKFGRLAEIPRVNFQVLRRTTATQFQNHGRVKDVQELLRHHDAATTLNNYQKVISASLAAATDSWDQTLSFGGGTVQ